MSVALQAWDHDFLSSHLFMYVILAVTSPFPHSVIHPYGKPINFLPSIFSLSLLQLSKAMSKGCSVPFTTQLLMK